MRKFLLIGIWAACCCATVLAQTTTNPGVARDPNPPFGAAAGAGNRTPAVPNAGAQPRAGQAATPTAIPGAAANGAGTTGSGVVAKPGTAGESSGASTTPGMTQGALAERPGAAIASRGATTAASAAGNAGPYDPSSAPGWSMMTPQEQQNYSGRMSSFTSVAQCRAYHQAYMAQIQARARSMGQIVQSEGSDPCAALQQQGALK